jgi:hypothetical protein
MLVGKGNQKNGKIEKEDESGEFEKTYYSLHH